MTRGLGTGAVLLAIAVSGFAQTVTGTLECRVTDPSGAGIAGAAISVKNDDTGLERATKTNQDGYAQLTFLPIGRYVITAASQGFAKDSRPAQVDLNTS